MQDGELYIEAQYEAKEIKINGSNHWKILHHWPKSINSSMDRGHEVLRICGNRWLPPQSSNKRWQSFNNNHQYMPHWWVLKGEIAVCGSSTVCWMTGEVITVATKRAFCLLAMNQFYWPQPWHNILQWLAILESNVSGIILKVLLETNGMHAQHAGGVGDGTCTYTHVRMLQYTVHIADPYKKLYYACTVQHPPSYPHPLTCHVKWAAHAATVAKYGHEWPALWPTTARPLTMQPAKPVSHNLALSCPNSRAVDFTPIFWSSSISCVHNTYIYMVHQPKPIPAAALPFTVIHMHRPSLSSPV